MKRISLFALVTLALATAAAFASGADCGDCPSRGNQAGRDSAINCPLAEKAARKADGRNCAGSLQGVRKAVANTPGGVEIVFTAADKAGVKELQELVAAKHAGKAGGRRDCPCRVSGSVTRVENTPSGVKVVITGRAPGIVKKIQELAARKEAGCGNCGPRS